MRARHFTLLLLAGCGLPGGDVFKTTAPLTPWDSCDLALDKAQPGDACVGISTCSRTDGCCLDKLECASGLITSRGRNCDACPKCADDDACPSMQWCLASLCQPCPVTKCTTECPAPFVHLSRNGCGTCDCGPPSDCSACLTTEKCAPGAFCQSGCSGSTCCVNACTAPGCTGAAPEGCTTACGAQSCGTVCRAEACHCEGGGWHCTPQCATGLEAYVSRCTAP